MGCPDRPVQSLLDPALHGPVRPEARLSSRPVLLLVAVFSTTAVKTNARSLDGVLRREDASDIVHHTGPCFERARQRKYYNGAYNSRHFDMNAQVARKA